MRNVFIKHEAILSKTVLYNTCKLKVRELTRGKRLQGISHERMVHIYDTGSTMDNPFWDFLRDILHAPTEAQIECHHPKPILLDTGDVCTQHTHTHIHAHTHTHTHAQLLISDILIHQLEVPYPWEPAIAPVQLFQIGQLAIIGVPGEFTYVMAFVSMDGVGL